MAVLSILRILFCGFVGISWNWVFSETQNTTQRKTQRTTKLINHDPQWIELPRTSESEHGITLFNLNRVCLLYVTGHIRWHDCGTEIASLLLFVRRILPILEVANSSHRAHPRRNSTPS